MISKHSLRTGARLGLPLLIYSVGCLSCGADPAPPAMPMPQAGAVTTTPPTSAGQPGIAAETGTSPVVTVPPATRIFTIQEAVHAALIDPTVALRWRFSHDQAQQNVALAEAARVPTVSSTARIRTRSDSNLVDVSSDQTGFIGERDRVGVIVAYPLYDGGRITDQIHASRAELTATDSSIRASRDSVISKTKQQYYALLRAQQAVETSVFDVKAAQQHLDAAQARYKIGTVTKEDVLTAQSAFSSASAAQQSHNAELIAARVVLAQSMGLDVMTEVPGAKDPGTPDALKSDLPTLMTEALQYDPKIQGLRAVKQRDIAILSGVRAERSPNVTLQLSSGYANRQSTTNSASTSSGTYSLVLLDLTMPLLEQQSQRANERSHEDEVQLSQLAIDDAVSDLRSQVLLRYNDYAESLSNVSSAQSALDLATEAQRLAEERYAIGKGTQLEVLDSLTRLTQAREQFDNSVIKRDESIELLKSIVGMNQVN